jgi:hypothetical protein
MGELRLGPAAEVDRGTGPITQFDVAGDEVGVEVGQEDVLDRVSARLGVGDVLIDVTLWIAAVFVLSSVIRYDAWDRQAR